MHVTGSFLFLITRLIAVISLFNKGPAYFFFTYFVILCIDACFLCEQENASLT